MQYITYTQFYIESIAKSGVLHNLIDYNVNNMDECFEESSSEIKKLPSSS